jgi:hypothetical protein
MTYRTHILALVSLLAVAVTSLSVSGCVGGSCNCPNSGGYTMVTIPAAQSSPIIVASTNGPCTISGVGNDTVSVSASGPGGCQVLAQLTNGDRYTFSVQFVAETIHGACDCGVLHVAGGTPVQTLTDAGFNG